MSPTCWVSAHVCAEVPHRQFVFNCGAEMTIIAFIERNQTDVIEKILRHGGLWEEQPARGPPAGEPIRTSA